MPVEWLHDRLAGRRVVLNDANARLCRPGREARGICRSQSDAVVAARRVDERRFEARHLHECESLVGFGIATPTDDDQAVRGEVRVAVFARVDLGEVDPRVVGRVRIGEDTDLGDRDEVAPGGVVAADDREIKGADRRVDDRLARSAGEDHDDGVGVGALFNFEIQLGGSGGWN